jgi:hypothetical protein
MTYKPEKLPAGYFETVHLRMPKKGDKVLVYLTERGGGSFVAGFSWGSLEESTLVTDEGSKTRAAWLEYARAGCGLSLRSMGTTPVRNRNWWSPLELGLIAAMLALVPSCGPISVPAHVTRDGTPYTLTCTRVNAQLLAFTRFQTDKSLEDDGLPARAILGVPVSDAFAVKTESCGGRSRPAWILVLRAEITDQRAEEILHKVSPAP